MKVEFSRREDKDWTLVVETTPTWNNPDGDQPTDAWAVRLTGTTTAGRKFILNLTQDADGVVKITEVKGRVRIDAMCGKVEVIGNEF